MSDLGCLKAREDIGMKDIRGEGAVALAQPEKYGNGNGVFWIIRWFRSTISSIMDAETYLSGVSKVKDLMPFGMVEIVRTILGSMYPLRL